MSHSIKYAERGEDGRRRLSINFGILIPLFVVLLAIGLAAAHWAGLV